MTQMRFAQVMARIVDRPLLILPRHAMAMWNTLSARFGTAPGQLPGDPHAEIIDQRFAQAAAPSASRFAGDIEGDDGRARPYRVQNGVGILSVVGELVNRGAWIGANSGLVSYEGLKFQLAQLEADRDVRNVILDIDSPGGEAVGFELATDAVRKLSASKPVYAVVNSMAASAAYALASGARRIFTSPTGLTGSIGVVMLHLDFSAQLEADGVKPTLIFAGEHKVDGNPFEALPQSVRSDLQTEVLAFYDAFIQTVAEGRAGKTSAKAARETEARIFIGADAIDARLADEIGTFEQVLDALSARNTRKSARSSAMSRKARAKATTEDEDETLLGGGDPEEPEAPAPEPAPAPAPALVQEPPAASGADALASRITAILADERSQGRERFAITLAYEARDMSAEKVLELAVAQSSAAATKPIAARAAETGADAVSSLPAKDASASKIGWAKATAAVNKRIEATR